MSERKEGLYWIWCNGRWEIFKWLHGDWFSDGFIYQVHEISDSDVGLYIEPPPPQEVK